MSFWRSETLKSRGPAEHLIEPFDPSRVMRGAYELSVGGEAYVTSNDGANTILGPAERIIIPAGQFGLLVTKEIVRVPNDAIAFLSIKATTKLQGLVNVSGFHVDPGYDCTLKFAVYNAGPQIIYIDQNQPVFLIWYASLDQPTEDLYVPRPGTSKSITAEDVKRIAGKVASPAELKAQLDQLTFTYDKRIHQLETNADKRIHTVENKMQLLQGIFIALLLVFVGSWIKSSLFPDSSATSSPATTTSTSSSSSPSATGTPAAGSPSVGSSTKKVEGLGDTSNPSADQNVEDKKEAATIETKKPATDGAIPGEPPVKTKTP